MSLPTHLVVFLLGQSVFLIFLGALIYLMRREPEVLGIGFLFLVPIWFSFKHGFVRQDAHIVNFFPFLLAVIAILMMNAGTRRGIQVLAASGLLVGVLAATATAITKVSLFLLLNMGYPLRI